MYTVISGFPLLLTSSADLKKILKSIIALWESNIVKAAIMVLIMLGMIKLLNLVFKSFKGKNTIHLNFIRSILQALIVIFFLIQIGSLSDAMAKFYNTLLMSSSLLVVVLGFVFQEGLSNIVHGFILTFFKPFDIGDRVKINVDGVDITGYIRSINLRNTVIQNVYNNSSVIVPNAKMDLCVIDNSYFDESSVNSNFLDIEITYESNLDKACKLLSLTIDNHPLVQKVKKSDAPPTAVLVSQLGTSGVTLRASVITSTIEENFVACSDIRKDLLHLFALDPELEFAYPHVVTVPYANTESSHTPVVSSEE